MNNLINEYKKAVFNLSIAMASVYGKNGRRILEETTDFDISRITWFVNIANSYNHKFTELLPEHFLEVHGMEKEVACNYLNIAQQKKLKPLELRKYIRSNKTVIQNNSYKIPANDFLRLVMLIKHMPPSEKQRAIDIVNKELMNNE